jgi:glycosyltransferase involved in cell wall biosynthesis
MCNTRGRPGLLSRAIDCFMRQTYGPRELVIVYEADDVPTRDFLATQDSCMIRAVEVPTTPKLQLGGLRNVALASSQGLYVAVWDDDDWHAPERLAAQIEAMNRCSKLGCVLQRLTLFDPVHEGAFVSHKRCWEGSLVARRDAIAPYAELDRGEDTPVVVQLYKAGDLAMLDSPELYVYVYHGDNTWDRSHWDDFLLRRGKRLSPEASRQVMSNMGYDPSSAVAQERRLELAEAARLLRASKRRWTDRAREWLTWIARGKSGQTGAESGGTSRTGDR